MKIRFILIISLIVALFSPPAVANAWDPQPTNPFPGVAFGSPIPGLSKTITCSDNPQIPDDCIRAGGGQVDCPPWTANDITWAYRADGSVSSLTSWCRNSWTPPTTADDDEDFRNRQNIAIAEATAVSQAWANAHPGQQKCVPWGPIVHANGISVSSGGVCANPVAGPSRSSSDSSDVVQPAPNTGGSTDSIDSTESTPAIDLAQFGIGKPFTRVILGSVSVSGCPSGFMSASNPIFGIGNSPATECWPADAWAAYSVGGSTWANFRQSNISEAERAAQAVSVEVNRVKALALNKAQQLSNSHIGENVCVPWKLGELSGSECSYTPVQGGSAIDIPVFVALDAVSAGTSQVFAGSIQQLSDAVAAVVDNSAIAKAITNVLSKVSALSKKVVKSTTRLPTAAGLDYKATSSTPGVCTISRGKILVKKTGTCNIKYAVSYDSSTSSDALDSTNTFVLNGKIKVKK
jgi:hypothetical protein